MTESTDRLKHLYGEPASSEQIKLYFDTLIRTYIELCEKHQPDILEQLEWYSQRPLKYVFYADTTTVCFTLIGSANKEGAEQIYDTTEMTNIVGSSSHFLYSSTSLNGQKIYSINSAIREAIAQYRIELKKIELPVIKDKLEDTGKELNKIKPNINKIRDHYNAICESVRQIASDNVFESENDSDKSPSPFRQANLCPLVGAYVNRIGKLEVSHTLITNAFDDLHNSMKNFKEDIKDSVETFRKNRTYTNQNKVNLWVVFGIILSFVLGLSNLIYSFFKPT